MGSSRVSLLKSEVVGQLPTASAMAVGELAVNYADKKIFGKHPGSGAVVQVAASPIHKSAHAMGGSDVLTPADIGAIAKNISDSKPVNNIRAITSSEYDALGSPDANTIYFIL
jgi:hypothetical protein